VALFEALTGKTLQPAQPERLFINLISYRESLLRVQIQAAAVKNLVRFSSGQMLDELGTLVGCYRLMEQPARTTLRVTLVAPLGVDYTVSAGLECGSKDGVYIFVTTAPLVILAGQISGDVYAVATTPGISGNGYIPGDVNIVITPLSNVSGVVNVTTTVGGSDIELDDHYIERILIAPDSYSTAGPEDAYIYWAKTAHQDIIDVAVLSSAPVVVDIYPLMSTGLPPNEIIDLVTAALMVRKRRPLTDQVNVYSPTEVQIQIEVSVTLYDSVNAHDAEAIAGITLLLNTFADSLRSRLGCDQVIDQIRAAIRGYRGVYSTDIILPAADRTLNKNEWLNCTGIRRSIQKLEKLPT